MEDIGIEDINEDTTSFLDETELEDPIESDPFDVMYSKSPKLWEYLNNINSYCNQIGDKYLEHNKIEMSNACSNIISNAQEAKSFIESDKALAITEALLTDPEKVNKQIALAKFLQSQVTNWINDKISLYNQKYNQDFDVKFKSDSTSLTFEVV